MYLNLKIGKRGEVVIPAIVRRKYKLKQGGTLRLKAEENSLSLVFSKEGFITWLKETAKNQGMQKNKLVYGDRLYEEVF